MMTGAASVGSGMPELLMSMITAQISSRVSQLGQREEELEISGAGRGEDVGEGQPEEDCVNLLPPGGYPVEVAVTGP